MGPQLRLPNRSWWSGFCKRPLSYTTTVVDAASILTVGFQRHERNGPCHYWGKTLHVQAHVCVCVCMCVSRAAQNGWLYMNHNQYWLYCSFILDTLHYDYYHNKTIEWPIPYKWSNSIKTDHGPYNHWWELLGIHGNFPGSDGHHCAGINRPVSDRSLFGFRPVPISGYRKLSNFGTLSWSWPTRRIWSPKFQGPPRYTSGISMENGSSNHYLGGSCIVRYQVTLYPESDCRLSEAQHVLMVPSGTAGHTMTCTEGATPSILHQYWSLLLPCALPGQTELF